MNAIIVIGVNPEGLLLYRYKSIFINYLIVYVYYRYNTINNAHNSLLTNKYVLYICNYVL